jgi:DNA processing protein
MVKTQTQRPHTRERVPGLVPMFEGIRKVVYGDPLFPRHLTSVPNVPISLFYKGELRESDSISVAVVGSRRASSVGKKRAGRLAAELVGAGITIVSGLAEGIDGAAHRGALTAGGRTIAVMGTGLNHVYPQVHEELFSQIIDQGAAVSQFAPGFTGYRSGRNFLQRNHVLDRGGNADACGMGQVLIVVEAQQRSGSAAAIRVALEQGRPVGLLRSLVEAEAWAAQLVAPFPSGGYPGRAFVVAGTEDVVRRVEI